MDDHDGNDCVAAGTLVYDGAREADVVAAHRAFAAGAEAALRTRISVQTARSPLPEHLRGRRVVLVDFLYAGSLDRAVVAHADQRDALGTPAVDTVEPRPPGSYDLRPHDP